MRTLRSLLLCLCIVCAGVGVGCTRHTYHFEEGADESLYLYVERYTAGPAVTVDEWDMKLELDEEGNWKIEMGSAAKGDTEANKTIWEKVGVWLARAVYVGVGAAF